MPSNAQRRRAARDANKLRQRVQLAPERAARAATAPTVYVRLLDYVAREWRVSRRQAREWLLAGKINVNGSVWAYPDVPKHIIEHDDLGRLRIMVEGIEDPRPALSTVPMLERKT